jgi:hypothetical protein
MIDCAAKIRQVSAYLINASMNNVIVQDKVSDTFPSIDNVISPTCNGQTDLWNSWT